MRGVAGARRYRPLARGLWAGAELVVTAGLVLLLLVVHQVWWTNRQALAGARSQVRALEREWEHGGGAEPAAAPAAGPEAGRTGPAEPGATPAAEPPANGGGPDGAGAPPPARRPAPPAPRWDQAYAVLRIPRLGVVAPVAEGISKRQVLDKGYVGHYAGTAQPGAPGNFALAGHRNTHGEPFRYINRLRTGDELIVDLRGRRYTYVVGRRLDQTLERDTGVIDPVPRSLVHPEAGYRSAGSYITLTTCTPEFTSRYRLVVWGTLRGVADR